MSSSADLKKKKERKSETNEESRNISLFVPVAAVSSGCPPQMIELIHNYGRSSSSIYLLCINEQTIMPLPIFGKHEVNA